MGRIKTQLVKRTTLKLFESYGKEFNTSFENNKKKVVEYVDCPSKKIRNIIAGYITRLVKNQPDY